MKILEVVKAVRKDGIIVAARLEEQVYWVGSNYALVKMDQDQFNRFREIYNSYAYTDNIPESIEVGQSIHNKYGGGFRPGGPKVEIVLDLYNKDLKPVYRTNFNYLDGDRTIRLYSVNGILGGYDSKYDRILDQFNQYVAQGPRYPIRCYDEEGFKAVVMPLNLYAITGLYDGYSNLIGLGLPERR